MVGGDIKLEETAKTNLRASGRCQKIMHEADELINSRAAPTPAPDCLATRKGRSWLFVCSCGWKGGGTGDADATFRTMTYCQKIMLRAKKMHNYLLRCSNHAPTTLRRQRLDASLVTRPFVCSCGGSGGGVAGPTGVEGDACC